LRGFRASNAKYHLLREKQTLPFFSQNPKSYLQLRLAKTEKPVMPCPSKDFPHEIQARGASAPELVSEL